MTKQEIEEELGFLERRLTSLVINKGSAAKVETLMERIVELIKMQEDLEDENRN